MEKMALGGPKWGQEDFFPTNPDLVDVLGKTDSQLPHCMQCGHKMYGFPTDVELCLTFPRQYRIQ